MLLNPLGSVARAAWFVDDHDGPGMCAVFVTGDWQSESSCQ
jgi:hypothetical protein